MREPHDYEVRKLTSSVFMAVALEFWKIHVEYHLVLQEARYDQLQSYSIDRKHIVNDILIFEPEMWGEIRYSLSNNIILLLWIIIVVLSAEYISQKLNM